MLEASTLPPFLGETLAKTGYVLPFLTFTLIILAILYPDRAVFSPPHRPECPKIQETARPLTGDTIDMVKNGTHEIFERVAKWSATTKNNCFRLSILGAGSQIFLGRPEYVQYVQHTNFENYPKGKRFRDRLRDFLGDGIFNSDGEMWRAQRKLASHIFSAFQFRTWIEVVVHKELDHVIAVLDGISAKDGPGTLVLPELFFRYTLSTFTKMAFSVDLDCLTSDYHCLDKPVEFSTNFDFVQGVINDRFANPLWWLTEKFTSRGQRARRSIKQIRSFALTIIKDRIAARKDDKVDEAKVKAAGTELVKEGKDLLDLFMDSTLDEQYLLDVVLNFLIAGRDTTAQTLSWLFYQLMVNPEHVQRIRDEVRSVLGAPEDGVKLAYEDMKRLPYTQACISEALRLHPPVPANTKMVIKDDVIVPAPNDDNLPSIRVYAGESIFWSDKVNAQNPAIWGDDCALYRPSRFLEPESTSGSESGNGSGSVTYKTHSVWKAHWFNGGPRLCLGMNLAHYEALTFVAAVVPRWDVKWASKEQGQQCTWPPKYANSLTHPLDVPYTCVLEKLAT